MFIALSLLAPGILVGLLVVRNYSPWKLVQSLLWRYRWLNLFFILLMAISVGIGTALLAQEKALRTGTAKAAEKFDLIIAAPGSKLEMMMAAVYLQPVDAPLLGGAIMERLNNDPRVSLAAPIAYGDSYKEYPIVGSTEEFVTHLSGSLAEGRIFTGIGEVVIGAKVAVDVGNSFSPVHGHGAAVEGNQHADKANNDSHDGHHHHEQTLKVVGRMAMTGSPWDKAIISPVESVWQVHGLGTGHPPGDTRLGHPFPSEHFPGTPAIIVHAEQMWANYALASEYSTEKTMAFFPGTSLAKLHAMLGDARRAMSLMSTLSEILVAISILIALVILARLFSRRFSLLRAIGAPGRFVFAIMWNYISVLVTLGSVAGLMTGYCLGWLLSYIITRQTDIVVQIQLSWVELHHVAAFFSLALCLALVPAYIAFRSTTIKDLRAG